MSKTPKNAKYTMNQTDRLNIVFSFIVAQEGTTYSDTPGDSGGPTKYGVTLDTWRSFNHNWKLTGEDVKHITYAQALAVFKREYWNVASNLPIGIDLAVSDMAWNAGCGRAVKLLQTALGFSDYNVDGVLGPVTIGAASNINPTYLINEYGKVCDTFYAGCQCFNSSLEHRNQRRIKAALDMVSNANNE
jgi:lysozyme family protein